MKKYSILCLTDHSKHSPENSVYALVQAMSKHHRCQHIDVASRGTEANKAFFFDLENVPLTVARVDDGFDFREDGSQFAYNARKANLQDFDFIFMRLPRPITAGFFEMLTSHFPDERIFNRPSGIEETSSKAFLLQVARFCPPIRLIRSKADLLEFQSQFPIVLKPLKNYGGKGILKVADGKVQEGMETPEPLDQFLKKVNGTPLEYLGMKYLKNVGQGDKRVVVVNGRVMSASLRLPATGSWMCNVAQGGSAEDAVVEPAEQEIIDYLSPILLKKGIVMYGMDTLMGDEGHRVLSEVNTLSIGGIAPAGQAVVNKAAAALWDYLLNQTNDKY